MTDKKTIKAEIERLKNELIQAPYKSEIDEGRISAFEDIILFIDSLPEEPFDYTNATIVQKDFAEPINDDLKEAAVEYADWAIKQPKDFCISAIADYDNGITEGFKAGAQWQKKQMMKNAVDGVVHHFLFKDDVAAVHYTEPANHEMSYYMSANGYQAGDKVKIIVIKEIEK